MSEITDRLEELEPFRDEELIVYCHHGMRSQQVANWLQQQGFSNVKNMTGGIDHWSREINPQLPRYG